MYKVSDYLEGCFNFPIDEGMITAAMAGRDLDPLLLFGDVEQKDRDLLLADLLIMLSRSSMGYTQETSSDSFAMKQRGELIPLADRKAMVREANRIYSLYGEKTNVRPQSALNIYPDEETC